MQIDIVSVELRDNKAFMLSFNETIIYQLDLNNGDISKIIYDNTDSKFDYLDICIWHGCFILIPGDASCLVFLDGEGNEIKKVEIPEYNKYVGPVKIKFFRGYVYNNLLYLFGFSIPCVMVFDLLSDSFRIIEYSLPSGTQISNKDGFCYMHFACVDNRLYYPFDNANIVMEVNLDTSEIIMHTIQNNINGFVSVEKINKKILLFPRDEIKDSIVIWDTTTGNEEVVDIRANNRIYNILISNGLLFGFTNSNEDSLCVDLEKKVSSTKNLLGDSICYEVKEYAGKKFIFCGDCFFELSCNGDLIKTQYNISDEISTRVKMQYIKNNIGDGLNNNIILEKDVGLAEFIQYLNSYT